MTPLRLHRTLQLIVPLALAVAAAAPARAEPAPVNLALVVANNRSLSTELPDLQYADDDGARYFRLFQALPGEAALLTTFDRATRGLHAATAASARPATIAEVKAAAARLAEAARAARARGARVALYFVFAGHGTVEGGRGQLDLEDGRIDGSFLEREILDRIGADVAHFILDSCNSFFVVNPRKPGGRRWATPKDMALGFGQRHPNVGLFLSTSAEAEVYEWSELESGIFSHEVRSGLHGAADADGDGLVSYAELGAFVERANAGIDREQFRPHVFVRGPRGDGSAPLFAVHALRGRRLRLGDERARLWIRNAAGERLVDLHKEPGPLALVLPEVDDASRLSVHVRRAPVGVSARPTVTEHEVPAGGAAELELAALAVRPTLLPRGLDRVYGALFAQPFGPQAFAAAQKEAGREGVYGLSKADEARAEHYLREMARTGRTLRLSFLGVGIGVGAAFAGLSLMQEDDAEGREARIGYGAAGALTLGLALAQGLGGSAAERTYEAFKRERAAGVDSARLLAAMEGRLEATAQRDRRMRAVAAWSYLRLGAVTALGTTAGLFLADDRSARWHAGLAVAGYGLAGALVRGGLTIRSQETDNERLLRLMRTDPGFGLRLGVAPTADGVSFGLSGRF